MKNKITKIIDLSYLTIGINKFMFYKIIFNNIYIYCNFIIINKFNYISIFNSV